MYIPRINLETDKEEIIAFMQQFSFATIVTAKDNVPTATHLPFLVSAEHDNITLTSHFARANDQWKDIESHDVLVIFSEPHAYISPKHYDKELNVPTWNYISVHAYGQGEIITDPGSVFKVLENTIDNYETSYKQQWEHFPVDYKLKLSKGIVAFNVIVKDLQAKKKLSQNRSETEKEKIINTLSTSNDTNEQLIAEYMKKEQVASK
jgi:transcriptional regulator